MYEWRQPWFKATGVQESKSFSSNYLTDFLIDLDGIGLTVETCEWDEPCTILSCPISIQVREPYTGYFLNRNFNISLISFIYRPVVFQIWSDGIDHQTLHFHMFE